MAQRIYTHARQFPHLAGKEVEEIRDILRRAMVKQPIYATIMRTRNTFFLVAMFLLIVGLVQIAGWSIGYAMMLAGASGTAFLLAWNLVWVNTVVFRLTKEELGE